MKTNKNIIIVAGPTASGKTQTSLELATQTPSEIINFDSLLFYKELNIGTAKPTQEEILNIPHHLINTHSISTPINAADYSKLALPIIADIHARGKSVILVGGSGFYLQALLNGMYDSEKTDEKTLQKSNKVYSEHGIMPFLEILKEHDPVSFARYHENDHYRVRRAVEHFWMTDTSFSLARENMNEKKLQSPAIVLGWKTHFIYLDMPKDEHFQIIEKRTDNMVELGLIGEVKDILKMGYTGEEKPLKSIGYKETIQYINNKFKSLTDYKERLSINTRQLAKAQRTWFKKIDKNSYHPSHKDIISQDFRNFIEAN